MSSLFDSPEQHDGWHAARDVEEHDRTQALLIPRWSEQMAYAVRALPFESDQAFRAVDIGAGTGALSELLLQAYPEAQLTALEPQEGMLELIAERLARFGDAVRIEQCDFSTPSWADSLGGDFDAAISSHAIHRMSDEDKQRVYADICSLLKPTGAFVNADRVRAADSRIESALMMEWAEFMAGQIRDIVGEPCSASQVLERQIETDLESNVQTATIEQNIAWLREAGFAVADCIWRFNVRCVFVASKRITEET